MTTPYTAAFYTKWRGTSLESARQIVPFILEIVQPRSVVDVGCGVGTWLAAFHATGVTNLLGIDGAHVRPEQLLIPPHLFRASDLAVTVDVDQTFDIAVSLEVAEHLPKSRAESFVADLVRLAPVVLFSAAIPFQEGEGHINEQWPAYWAELFGRHDYVSVDCIRDRFWCDENVEYWYAQNAVLYVRRDRLDQGVGATTLREAFSRARPGMPLPLVHPLRYLDLADPRRMSLARSLKTIPTVAVSMMLRRLKRRS